MAKSEKIQISGAENSSAHVESGQSNSGGRFVYKLVRLDLEDVRVSPSVIFGNKIHEYRF